MNEGPSPELVSCSELTNTFTYIERAVRIVNKRVTDKHLSRRAIRLFDMIRILCLTNRENVNQLNLLAGQLLVGAVESGYENNGELLEREIEYVRGKLGQLFN